MSPSNVIASISVLTFFTVVFFLLSKNRDKWEKAVRWGVYGSLLALLTSTIIILLFSTERVPRHSMIFTTNNTIREIFREDTLLWNWDKRLEGAEVVSYVLKAETITMNLSPISENSKVKRLKYFVSISYSGSPEECLRCLKYEQLTQMSISKWVKYWLYEFNEKHSKELAELYNPMDLDQQFQFYDLVRSFLESRFRGTNFSVSRVNMETRFALE